MPVPVRTPPATALGPELQWRLDLARSPGRTHDRARAAVRHTTAVLSVVAAAVWAVDVLQVALA